MTNYLNVLIRAPQFVRDAHDRLRDFSANNLSEPSVGLFIAIGVFAIAVIGIGYFNKR